METDLTIHVQQTMLQKLDEIHQHFGIGIKKRKQTKAQKVNSIKAKLIYKHNHKVKS